MNKNQLIMVAAAVMTVAAGYLYWQLDRTRAYVKAGGGATPNGLPPEGWKKP